MKTSFNIGVGSNGNKKAASESDVKAPEPEPDLFLLPAIALICATAAASLPRESVPGEPAPRDFP